ncbi:MAG: hypothetical protein EHM12_04440 [Dehalococcoidia bacterium]|nr:MAG: hypothetical protein EHM12_04440 [Dehalococcoidia bacterium]
MGKLIEANLVEQTVRRYLQSQGYALNLPRKKGETGVDITSAQGNTNWLIEVIGFQSHPPIRSREFYEAFFRVISRDRGISSDVLVIALPIRFKDGMKQRQQQYPVAWGKLAAIFPNLYLWYVDTEKDTIEKYPWSNPVD